MSYEDIVDKTKEIETILESLGATGKGLHSKVDSLNSILTESLVRSIRKLATIRNKLLHESTFVLTDDVYRDFISAYLYIKENIKNVDVLKAEENHDYWHDLRADLVEGSSSDFGSESSKASEDKINLFKKIIVNGNGNVNIFYNKSDKLDSFSSDSTSINIKVVNNVLFIQSNNNSNNLVNVSSSLLDEIILKGIVDVSINGLNISNLKVVLSGSGDFMVKNLNANLLHVALIGSGDVSVGTGGVNDLHIELLGSGDINVSKLKSHNTRVVLMGSGDVFASCDNVLDSKLLGSGDITIYGNPVVKNVKNLGSGDVNFLT